MCQEMKSTSTIGSSNCQRYPRDSLIDFSPEGTHTTKPSCPIVLKILKHRNVAHFLLYMLKSVTQIGSKAGDVTIVLYVILLKRAIVELTNIGKYLHYGVEDGRLGLTQSPKVYARFKKTSDCMHLTKIISNSVMIKHDKLP